MKTVLKLGDRTKHVIFAIAIVGLMLCSYLPGKPIKAIADGENEYYDFVAITSFDQMPKDSLIYFSKNTQNLTPGTVVTQIPTGTAVLKIGDRYAANTGTGTRHPVGYEYVEVHVETKGDGFDNCVTGYLHFDPTDGLIYNCTGGYVTKLIGAAVYTCKSRPLGSGPDPLPPAPAPEQPAAPAPEPEPEPEYPPHEHTYSWVEFSAATDDCDGELRYMCTECGDILERSYVSAYGTFNANTASLIENAGAGQLVRVATRKWISFNSMALDALALRPDVSLEVTFLSEGHKGEEMSFVIPAGTDINAVRNGAEYCGFLYLQGVMGSGTIPQSTADTNLVAETPVVAANTEPAPAANIEPASAAAPAASPEPVTNPVPAANTARPTPDRSDPGESAIGSGSITIPSGVDSYYVAKQLEDAGIVASASDLDRYLCRYDYDRHILTGTKAIPEGADYRTIAQILTR